MIKVKVQIIIPIKLSFAEKVQVAKYNGRLRNGEYVYASIDSVIEDEVDSHSGKAVPLCDFKKTSKVYVSPWARSTSNQRKRAKKVADKALAQIDIDAIRAKYRDYAVVNL